MEDSRMIWHRILWPSHWFAIYWRQQGDLILWSLTKSLICYLLKTAGWFDIVVSDPVIDLLSTEDCSRVIWHRSLTKSLNLLSTEDSMIIWHHSLGSSHRMICYLLKTTGRFWHCSLWPSHYFVIYWRQQDDLVHPSLCPSMLLC